MSLSLAAYRAATRALSPLVSPLLHKRAKRGKEDYGRLNERLAKNLPPRQPGPLVWLHGASVGESLLLLELGDRLLAERPDIMLLFTSQTQTAAKMLGQRLPDRAIHAMAPVDTPAAAKRFVSHWKPDMLVLAEGEIWPNLLREAKACGMARTLVNARMTQKSADGWVKWKGLLKHLLGDFDAIIAADADTRARLGTLLDRDIPCPGNLKSAQTVPEANPTELKRQTDGFKGPRRCIVAASTHEGEEEVFLDAVKDIKDVALVIAPRHPERGGEIESLLKARRLTYARRSRREEANTRTQVLLADTLGEMGIWYRLADVVYLGGGYKDDVGGHNPLEPVRLGKPVVSGPHTFNFRDVFEDLSKSGCVTTALTPERVRTALLEATPLTPAIIAKLNAEAEAPMIFTMDQLRPLLPPRDERG